MQRRRNTKLFRLRLNSVSTVSGEIQIVYPSGNAHFNKVIPEYQSILTDNNKNTLIGCAFEKYIDSIQDDDPKIIKWKNYLDIRYIVREK
jgi:hypothetical protein